MQLVNIDMLVNMTTVMTFSNAGHEFIGRNIAPGCLLLSVAYMDEISTDLSCPEHSSGCMTVEPGVWWLQAYKAVSIVRSFSIKESYCVPSTFLSTNVLSANI